MSSIPGYTLEDFLAWNWELVVEGQAETNFSVGVAELLGNVKHRPRITKEQFEPIVKLYEPYRELVESRLCDFDEDSQSWRDYAQYILPDEADALDDKVLEITRTFS